MSDAPRTPQQFAEERSHRDAEISNETGRAAAQAAILISGGAATAMLAYLAKGSCPALLLQAALCLFGYTAGVAAGAFMLFASMRSLDFYNVRWRDIAHPDGFPDSPVDPSAKDKAYAWYRWVTRSFIMAMSAFLLSSALTAFTLANQRITIHAARFGLSNIACTACAQGDHAK